MGGSETASPRAGDEHWLRAYARDHVAHLFVIAVFLCYPLVSQVLLRTPVGAEVDAFLPGTRYLILMLFLGLFAMSFDFISGYTGYLSFGHAAFYGTGAYFVILAANGKVPLVPQETPFVVTMLIGGLLAVGIALAIGAVSFRLSGVYFAMITLGFAQVGYELVRNWDYAATNPQSGPRLARGAPTPEIGVPYVDSLSVNIGYLAGDSFGTVLPLGIELGAPEVSYYAIGAVVLVSYVAMQRLIHSPFGRVMIAIRENEERAAAVGYDVFRYKMAAFGFSAFFASIAGALFAGYSRSVSPDNTFYFLETADALIVTIIGGIGTLAGPFFGSAFYQWLEDVLSSEQGGLAPYLRGLLPDGVLGIDVAGFTVADVINTIVDGRAPLFLGIVFVLFVLFVPNGLLGSLRDRLGTSTVGKYVGRRLERYRR